MDLSTTGNNKIISIIGVVVLAIVLGVVYFYFSKNQSVELPIPENLSVENLPVEQAVANPFEGVKTNPFEDIQYNPFE